jgi:hypothetical protein
MNRKSSQTPILNTRILVDAPAARRGERLRPGGERPAEFSAGERELDVEQPRQLRERRDEHHRRSAGNDERAKPGKP